MDCGEFGRMPAEAEDKDFAPLPEDDEALEPCPRVRDVRSGRANSTLSVRIVSFLIDNNIFHRLNPHLVASHEQLAFMVALEQDQVYVPCSDRVLFDLFTQRSHKNPQRRRIRSQGTSPHLFQNVVVSQNFPGIACQNTQQLVFYWG